MGHTITNSQNLIRISGCYRPISSSAPQQVARMTTQGKKQNNWESVSGNTQQASNKTKQKK